MKRIGAFSLAIIVFALSIIVYLPDITFADDSDKTIIPCNLRILNLFLLLKLKLMLQPIKIYILKMVICYLLILLLLLTTGICARMAK